MTTLFRRFGRLGAGSAAAATLSLGLVAMILVLGAPASAQPQDQVSCNTAVTNAPTGPATVSAASSAYGRVLVLGGSGAKAGCSLYVLRPTRAMRSPARTSRVPLRRSLSWGMRRAPTTSGRRCSQTVPRSQGGGQPHPLGVVTRTDVVSGESVQQVTYAGLPLYFFFQDEKAGDTDGANLFDNVVSPTGTWYLVEPSRGRIAPGRAQLQLETFAGGTPQQKTWLAVSMNDGFRVFPDAPFPVYTFSKDSGHKSACTDQCAQTWPPVLTSGKPDAIGYAVDQHALGTIVRPDGTHQVTYNGKPLYLYYKDAYIGTLPSPFNGPGGINGDGVSADGGTFNAIPLN